MTKLLLVGATITGIELCKELLHHDNFTLTILDDTIVQDEDLNCMLQQPAVGKNRAHAYLQVLKSIRRDIEINVEDVPLTEKSISFYKQFDIIVATIENVDCVIFLDEVCQQNKIKFFYAAVFGNFGFILHQVPCISYLSACKYVFQNEIKLQISPYLYYILFKVVHKFLSEYKRKPDIKRYTDDFEKLVQFSQEAMKNTDPPVNTIPPRYLSHFREKECIFKCSTVAQQLNTYIMRWIKSSKQFESGIKFYSPVSEAALFVKASDFEKMPSFEKLFELASPYLNE